MKVIAVLPTYNERGNIRGLVEEILSVGPHVEVLVVDDDSPDDTAELVREMEKRNPRVHLLQRRMERGRGRAGIAGFLLALRHGADAVVEMDADFSHHPRHIPALLEGLDEADLVIGSRYAPGGREIGRSLTRRLITRAANAYARLALGLRVRDCTSGYRCYRRALLEAIAPQSLVSGGPSIVEETLFATHLLGFRIAEVPIVFEDRRRGSSTLTLRRLIDTFFQIPRFRLTLPRRYRHGTEARAAARPQGPTR